MWLGEDTDDDNDSIPDLYELKQFDRFDYGANDDTDGDGFSNLQEYQLGMEANRSEEITNGGTSIRNSNILRFSDKTLGLYLDESIDDDNDSLPDRYEIKNFGSLSESATEDFDGDGFSNLREYQLGMEANRSEELVPGGTSIRSSNLLTLQLLTDTDGDGLPDHVETNTGIYVSSTDTGTDANKSDTDGDGFSDGWGTLEVIRSALVHWSIPPPPILIPPIFSAFSKTCRAGNSWLISTPPIPMLTLPSPIRLRMGTVPAEMHSSPSIRTGPFGLPRFSITSPIPRIRSGYG